MQQRARARSLGRDPDAEGSFVNQDMIDKTQAKMDA
jgi:hypothetical protein